MRWTVERDPRGFLDVRTFDRFDLADHSRLVREIVTRQDWQPGTDVLFDHRHLDFGDAGLAALRVALEHHSAHDADIGDGRAAIVMAEDADFGIGRQFAAIAEDRVSANLQVFREREEAERWLASRAVR